MFGGSFFFFRYVHTRGDERFELVISASWSVVPNRLSYPLKKSDESHAHTLNIASSNCFGFLIICPPEETYISLRLIYIGSIRIFGSMCVIVSLSPFLLLARRRIRPLQIRESNKYKKKKKKKNQNKVKNII